MPRRGMLCSRLYLLAGLKRGRTVRQTTLGCGTEDDEDFADPDLMFEDAAVREGQGGDVTEGAAETETTPGSNPSLFCESLLPECHALGGGVSFIDPLGSVKSINLPVVCSAGWCLRMAQGRMQGQASA